MVFTAGEPRSAATYEPVPLVGLVGKDVVPFPLYLRTADDVWVLYHPAAAALDESHIGRLLAEGNSRLFIHADDRTAYLRRIEHALDRVLLDRTMPLDRRADVLHGVAMQVAGELLAAPPDRPTLHRAQRVMMATSGLLLRDPKGFVALRRVLSADEGLASHSLRVGFLTMGLARVTLGGDAATLLQAGLAGLLHDVGSVGHEDLDHDPEHVERGAELLRGLGVPAAVVAAVGAHHERHDGSGFPAKLAGRQIPELARLVAIVDTFDTIHTTHRPRGSVFDSLRVLAQAYRGCFDERVALAFVKLFR